MAATDNFEAAKEKTYSGFLTLLKWTIPTIGIIALIVIILIS